MRILVISDSHGRVSEIEKAIDAQPDARHIFFLGDCVSDIEDLTYLYCDRNFHIVSGNCDYSSMLKSADTARIGGRVIYFTHGHTFGVKGGLAGLRQRARQENADIVLYGHTHIASIEYADGVHFVNPGSLCSARAGRTSYAVIDIEGTGVKPIIIETR